MGTNNQSIQIKELFQLSLLPVLAYIRVLVNLSGQKIKEGIILYFQDERQKEQILDLLLSLGGIEGAITGQRIPDGSNYDMILVEYHSFQKPDAIYKYLTCRDYLPLLAVNGVFPDSLKRYRNVISFENIDIGKISKQDLCATIYNCRAYIDQHPDDIINALTKTINYTMQESDVFKPQIYRALLATAYVIHQFLQFDNNDIININLSRTWIDELSIISMSEELELCGVLRKIIENFVDMHSSQIRIGDINAVDSSLMNAIITEKGILFDNTKYYFPDSLFELITQKLHDTIPYPRIKQELCSRGILLCDNTTNNYSQKRMIFSEDGEKTRKRFLILLRNAFDSDDSSTIVERWCSHV